MTQANHRLHDGGIGGVVKHAAHKRLIHFQLVNLKPLQVSQAGVTGTKVVNGHLHANVFQRADLLLCEGWVVHQVRFGQLQLQL